MRIFPIILVILVCVSITFGAVFTSGMFQSVSIEANNTTAAEQQTTQAYSSAYAWIYIIAALLIIAVIIMAFKLLQESAA